ncbi:MAG: tRNA wybutosine-synthesizing 3 family protein [Nanoarchaeota archaeon]
MVDQFLRRKKQQLMKNDRSVKQSFDERIKGLCGKINKSSNYYTTSSCSGRVYILIDSKEKRGDLFLFVSHDLVSFKDLKDKIDNIKEKVKGLVYFKQEPVILHVACRDLEHAQKLHDIAKESGWKRCGIIYSKDRVIVELNSTEKLEFPLIKDGKILVDDYFLKLIIDESNKKLKISWDKITRLMKAFD